MREDEQDEGLRRAFQELRKADRLAVPPFGRLPARARRRGADRILRLHTAWLAAALLLIGVGLGLVVVRNTASPPVQGVDAVALDLVAWRSPTDQLLLTTGRELTGELPRIGAFEVVVTARARTKRSDPTPLSH